MSDRREGISPSHLLLGAAAAAIVVGVLTVNVWWLTNVGLLLATLAVVAALAVLAQRLVQSQQHLHWDTQVQAPDPRRGADARVTTLRQQIELAAEGQEEALERLRALLADIADERLRDHRAVDRGEDPEAAALLGPDLTAYLAQRPAPPRARLTTDQLHRHVQKLEELS